MDNPIKKRIDELGISTHAAARILSSPGDEITQASVHHHYAGNRRISADSMEKYSGRMQISMRDMRDWNRFLKEQKIKENSHDNNNY